MLTINRTSASRGLLIAGAIAASLAFLPAAASAGECPADKVVAAGAGQKDEGHAASRVTDKVISSIDLDAKGAGFEGNLLRMRRLVVKPGGIVPWHSHGERPANIYILAGEITEYRSTCAIPIRHKAGDVVAEFGADLSHWWRNNGGKSAVLLSSDIFHDKMGDDHMM